MPDSGDKNWPPFRPMIRHDIEADILLDEAQALAKRSYLIFLFYYVALLGNLAAMIVQEITYKNVLLGIVLGIVYLLIVPPMDFFARHYSLYQGLKNDSKISFRWFFVIQGFDILFGIFILVGWSYGGGGGISALVYSFRDKHYVAGAFSALCVILISIQLFLSFKLWIDAHKYFKEKGWKLWPGK